jgi:hypothetical protein
VKAGEDKESFSQQLVFRVLALVIILAGLYIYYRWQQEKRRKHFLHG